MFNLRSSHTKDSKNGTWYLLVIKCDQMRFIFSTVSSLRFIIRYVSRVKWSNPGKGVSPYPTPQCGSYWKKSLRVTLDYGRQQLYFIHFNTHTHTHTHTHIYKNIYIITSNIYIWIFWERWLIFKLLISSKCFICFKFCLLYSKLGDCLWRKHHHNINHSSLVSWVLLHSHRSQVHSGPKW